MFDEYYPIEPFCPDIKSLSNYKETRENCEYIEFVQDMCGIIPHCKKDLMPCYCQCIQECSSPCFSK